MCTRPPRSCSASSRGSSPNDTDKDGTDDLLAGCLLSLSDGISAYAVRDNNQHGNIVDGLIAGLQRYREEMAACGKIT